MKVIGFAGKYYTLWEVTSSTTDFCNGKHCIIKSYTYLQNISFDKEKVFAMYPNIEIDEELRGRTKSFKSYKEYWDNIDTFVHTTFVGGSASVDTSCGLASLRCIIGVVGNAFSTFAFAKCSILN